MAALFAMAMPLSAHAAGGDEDESKKSEVTFLVSMTCENCRKRIEDNISFEKGVTALNVDLSQKTVSIEYNTGKTSPDKLGEAIRKLGYTATPLSRVQKAAADSTVVRTGE